ncbi:MAG: hypothetical protein LBK23_00645 [Oscillospiraceae bacterium]|nr:hypothetical protein [Oscillospiraceae bacterium]
MKNKHQNSNYKHEDRASRAAAAKAAGAPPRKNAPSPEEMQARLKKAKRNLIRRGPILAILMLFSLFMLQRRKPPEIVFAERSFISFYSEKSGDTAVLFDGSVSGRRLPGRVILEQTSLDGLVYAALTDAPEAPLWIISQNASDAASSEITPEIIATDVSVFDLAPGGGAVAYRSDRNGGVTVYNISARSSAPITSDPISGGMFSLTFSGIIDDLENPGPVISSPGGTETVLKAHGALFLWNGGTPMPLGGSYTPIAVPDGGEYVYAYADGGAGTAELYRLSADNAALLAPDASLDAGFVVSRDAAQILYHTADNRAHISDGAGATYDIAGEGATYPLTQPGGITRREAAGVSVSIYHGSSLLEAVYETLGADGERSLYAVAADGSSKRYIAGADSEFMVRSNGGSAYYVRNGALNLFQNSSKGGSTHKLDDNVSSALVISSDQKRVFYINNTGELRTLKGKGGPKLITDGAEYLTSAEDKGAFYLSGGALYRYDGSRSVKLADKALSVAVYPGTVCYFAPSDYGDGQFSDVYVSSDGETFTLAAEGVAMAL